MKYIVYTDKHGFIKRSLVKDRDSESDALFGVPAGPPDVRLLDWELIMKEMNNALASSGAFSWDDAQGSNTGIQAALSIVKRYLVALYREEASNLDNLLHKGEDT